MNPDVAKEILLAIGAPEEVKIIFRDTNPNFHGTIFITGQSEK
jgi:hypothetical protein